MELRGEKKKYLESETQNKKKKSETRIRSREQEKKIEQENKKIDIRSTNCDIAKNFIQAWEKVNEAEGSREKAKDKKNADEWQRALVSFLKKDSDGGTKALFLDFDGTMARFTDTPEQTLAVHGFLPAVKIFLNHDYKVAIITGRPIEGKKGILAALKRSGADDALIDRLDIFGSHGVEHRGHETEWKIQIPAEVAGKIAPYVKTQKQLLNNLQQRIEANEKLKGLGISFEPKALGATIHYRVVEASKRPEVKDELDKLLSEVLPEKSKNMDFSLLKGQNNEDFKKFTYNSATESFEIRLNPAMTGVEVNKGTSVKSLAERWRVEAAIAFGDDTTDLDMQTKLQELVDDRASSLKTQAFVGVKHDKSPSEIMTHSTIVVEGQERAVELLKVMAEEALRVRTRPQP